MPQLQSLVLTDRTTPTPVDKTFTPRDIVDGVGTVVHNGGVAIGTTTAQVSMKVTGARRYRGRLVIRIPVVQDVVVGGVTKPTVVRYALAELNVSYDEASSLQERNDLIGMVASALAPAKVLVNDALVKLEGVY